MFDYVSKRDPIATVFYCGIVPFGLAWAFHPSFVTGFMLETYLITCVVFVTTPFEFRKDQVKHRWFWKIMLEAGAIVHSVFLVGLWFLDARHPTFVIGTGTIFFVAFVVSVTEIVILGQIVKRYQPADQKS